MGISLSAQTAYFLWSLAMGAALAVLYDIVRAIRMAFCAGKVHIIVSDVLFFAVCGVLTSLFALPFNKGGVRGFILFGEAVGFVAYRFTIGAVMGKVYAISARIFQSFVQKTRKILEKIFKYLLKDMGILLYNVNVVIDKSRKKAQERKKRKRAAAARKRQIHRARQYHKGKIYEQKTYSKTADRGKKSVRQYKRFAG